MDTRIGALPPRAECTDAVIVSAEVDDLAGGMTRHAMAPDEGAIRRGMLTRGGSETGAGIPLVMDEVRPWERAKLRIGAHPTPVAPLPTEPADPERAGITRRAHADHNA